MNYSRMLDDYKKQLKDDTQYVINFIDPITVKPPLDGHPQEFFKSSTLRKYPP